jgi:SAM-dependent methyltransferase
MKFDRNYRGFYERAFEGADYATGQESETHAFSESLIDFLSSYRLLEGRCLEVGSGRGAFQDLVEDYYGIDIAWSAGKFLTKLFTVASATDLPYPAKSFDAIWSITVLEHVPEPERALQEMWRVLKTGGYLFLAPEWQCRPWAAQGYAVRPYSDFGFRGKLIKASIPLRDSLLFRSLSIFPRRIVRLVTYLLTSFHCDLN